jgi:GTPase SAR1 family protein
MGASLALRKGRKDAEILFAVLQDTAGQERFRTITASYYRGAQGVILGTRVFPRPYAFLPCLTARARAIVYDVSSRESFEALPRWLEELDNYVPPEVVKIVVGNKLDKVSKPFLLILPPRPLSVAIVHHHHLVNLLPSLRPPACVNSHTHTPSRNTLDKCPRQRARRSRRARDVFSSSRPPRRRWA